MSAKELMALKQLATIYLGFSADEIDTAVTGGALIEVMGDDKEDEG